MATTRKLYKLLLIICNVIYALTGVALLSVGIYAEVIVQRHAAVTNDSLESAPILLMVLGVLAAGAAFLGCYSVIRESYGPLIAYATLLALILITEVVAAVTAWYSRRRLMFDLTNSMSASLIQYGNNPAISSEWDYIQRELKCCGIYGYEDWQNNALMHGDVPTSCCKGIATNGCNILGATTENIWQQGCLHELNKKLTFVAELAFGFAVGVAILQVLGIFISCYMGHNLRRNVYEIIS